MTGAANDVQLSTALGAIFPTPASALAFLTFTILYMPCVAAFAATKREMGTWKEALLTALYQTVVAYGVAILVYFVARILL